MSKASLHLQLFQGLPVPAASCLRALRTDCYVSKTLGTLVIIIKTPVVIIKTLGTLVVVSKVSLHLQ